MAGTALASLLFAGPGMAQEWMEMRAIRQVGDEMAVDVSVEFAAGELQLYPAATGDLYDLELVYDATQFEPIREWESADRRGRLRVGVDADDVDFKRWDKLDRPPARLALGLGTVTPATLRIEVGAAESELDLGGVPLRGLILHTGASETRLQFTHPNPVRMEELELQVGAADFEVEQLGNARFDRFIFDGAIGDVMLDFTGEWEGDAVGEIRLGLGSLSLRLPAGIGVRIERSSVLTSFDASGFRKVDGRYVSDNWDEAADRFDLRIEAAFGSVEIERVY